MNKYKINYGLAAALLIAAFLVGWQTLLIVAALLFVFCEMQERVKNLAVDLVTFGIGLEIIKLFWEVIYKAVNMVPTVIDKLIGIINSYLDFSSQIDITKFKLYFLHPVTEVFSIANDVFTVLILLATLTYITSLLLGRKKETFFIGKYISQYVNKVLSYISSFNVANVNNSYTDVPQSNDSNVTNNTNV